MKKIKEKLSLWKKTKPDKVRDHCHLTLKYGGTAHNKCNNDVTQD